MHLTLFVPDLLWPDHENPQAFDFDQASSLARFLSLADHAVTPFGVCDSWESVLSNHFGFNEATPPLGALRLLGAASASETNNAYGRMLLCADPVNLGFIQQALVLSAIEPSNVSAVDRAALFQSLNDEFAGEGHFFTIGSRGQWYFAPSDHTMALPNLAACSRLLGRRIDADESRQVLGTEGLRWLNRIQMCLNDHPVNQAREMQGLPVINSVWPWGIGQLDKSAHHDPVSLTEVMGDDPLLEGLCTATGTKITAEATSATNLVLDTSLATAIAHDDLSGWRTAIAALVQRHVVPAMDRLSKDELTRLTLVVPTAYGTHRWTLCADTKGLKPSLFQRLLGKSRPVQDLKHLISTWSR